jgi:lipoprotein-anchoring transpeptidase ErfK/SrfK
VAVCDPDGDGVNDIITGTQYGGGPQVRTFNNIGEVKEAGFFAYAETFRGGVNLTCGDLDDDGHDELVTTPGPSGGPHVRIWELVDGAWTLDQEFFSFASDERGGVVSTIHDGMLYTTLQRTTGNHVVKSYVIHSPVQEATIVENHTTTTTGIIFADDKLFATAEDGGFIANTTVVFTANVPFGSVSAATTDFDNDGTEEIVAVADRPIFDESTEAKRIEVDISDQRMYAYENGILANSFLVSTGKYPFATPTGSTTVLAKLPYVDYTWSYGPGNPNNYSLGLVPWNLRIFPHIYIHYAYWHNNFGHPMSHGCVNVNLENVKWIYHWSDVGIPVEVRA